MKYHLVKRTRTWVGTPYSGPASLNIPASAESLEAAKLLAEVLHQVNPVGWDVCDTQKETIVYSYPEPHPAKLSSTLSSEFIERIAVIAHNANRRYCIAIGEQPTPPLWKDSPDWQKTSVRNGVVYRIDNLDAPLSANHENWMNEKLKEGWVYGLTKNVELKQHPCLVPYSELPSAQQAKDAIFVTVVLSLLGELDD